jgi:hypothetical protein
MEEALIAWLQNSALYDLIIRVPWIWPAAETLHFAGMAVLVGVVGTFDLRMLGMAKQLPVAPLHHLIPFGIAAFAINLLTGLIFVAGAPDTYVGNTAFYIKLVFIVLAGINVGAFYLTGIFRQVEGLGPGEDAPMGAMVIAGTSLVFWTAVIYFGRHLSYF